MSLGDGVGRGALVGAAAGFVVLGVLVAAIGRLAGLTPLDALGVGVVAALWGGAGFGALFGAVSTIARNERTELAVAAHSGWTEADG